ncbi:MAG: hypothetical protein H0U42_11540 [Thermoleophilaceae bacterium]|nr:hypothetical protein [Thermoleophilaceae bacterium]
MVRAVSLLTTLALTGCARGDAELPTACLADAGVIRSALAAAPGPVRLEGGVPLSACLDRTAGPAEVQNVGAVYLEVATDLASVGRRGSDAPEVAQLAYLVGAVERGADGSGGVYDELERRLQLELSGVARGSQLYKEGLEAGRTGG